MTAQTVQQISPAEFLAAAPKSVSGSDPWATLELPSGHAALVDAVDLELVRQFRWHALKSRHTCYVQTKGSAANGYQRAYLHRLLTGAAPGLVVDHINHDGLDNRRANLRVCTLAQNRANARGTGDGYRGVSYHPNNQTRPWRARWNRQHLGYFASEWEAAEAFNAVLLAAHGDFALLNTRRSS